MADKAIAVQAAAKVFHVCKMKRRFEALNCVHKEGNRYNESVSRRYENCYLPVKFPQIAKFIKQRDATVIVNIIKR